MMASYKLYLVLWRISGMKRIKFSPFSPKQKKILTWWLPNSPAYDYDTIIADGAVRSGKTLIMSLSYIMWSMSNFDGENFGMAGKTIGSFRRNVINQLKSMLVGRGYKVYDKRADNLLVITKGDIENYYYIFGGKDERSQDLVQGVTLAGFFFDEVALMPESFVNQATARCSVEGSRFWFNCNPDGPYHWFKLNWLDKLDLKNAMHLHFTQEDNPSLSEKVKKRYRHMYTGVFYKRYIEGLWVVAEGIVYDMFNVDEHVVNKLPELEGPIYISIDYGTQNATVFLMWQQGIDGVWYCIKEYYYSGRDETTQRTDKEYAQDLKTFTEGRKIYQVILDPSAVSFRTQLTQDGYKVRKANNSVLDGIRFTGSALQEGLFKIYRRCKKTISEFSSYMWDPKAVERGEDKPLKQFDHAMDAVRYFMYTVTRKRKGGVEVWT